MTSITLHIRFVSQDHPATFDQVITADTPEYAAHLADLATRLFRTDPNVITVTADPPIAVPAPLTRDDLPPEP